MVRLGFSLVFLTSGALWAQQYVISTIAGAGPIPPAPAMSVSIYPNALATDAAGDVYFTSGAYTNTGSHRIWKLSGGVITAIAGKGTGGYSGDGGPATSAQIGTVYSLAADGSGNLYIADGENSRIRKISASGTITTVAGNGTFGSSGDGGPATNAQVNAFAVAVDAAGNLYIADQFRIRKVSPDGIITTIAGNGTQGYSGDGGPATSAELNIVFSLAADNAGNVYLVDTSCGEDFCVGSRIRKISPSGIISTVAGNGTSGYSGDGGPATSAQISPADLAVDGSGNLYISDSDSNRIRKVSPSGIITTIVGNGTQGYSGDGGPAASSQLYGPAGVALDSSGNLYIADSGNYRIRKVSQAGVITTIAGNGLFDYLGDGGPATGAQLSPQLHAIALDAAGSLYMADQFSLRVRKVSPNGIISVVAGNGMGGFSGDGGPAASAGLGRVEGLATDAASNLYIADPYNYRIRKVSPAGIITTIAGTGTQGYSGDGGPANAAQLNRPVGVAVDGAGNLYIADYFNYRIRKVTPDGVITTMAGNGTQGHSGDGGPAASAQVFDPYAPVVDGAGNLYFAEINHHTIRKISASGIITTVAGTGTKGYSGDGGPAVNAQLSSPAGLAVDRGGNLYIGDNGNYRIRKVSPAGIITTIAGTGTQGYSGDGGPASAAQLIGPYGLAVDAAGNVYIADSGFTTPLPFSNINVVRLLEPDGPAPTITAVTNAASNLQGPIAPGEIVVLYHSGIGPAQQGQFHLNDAGLVDTQLDRTQVTFNGTLAPLVYTWTSSLSAIVPYSVSGTSAQVQLTFRGQTSAPFTVPVAPSSPGLFTRDSTGKGQAVATDVNGGYNSLANPTRIGTGIILFGTGEGQTSPAGIDGKPPTTPALPVSVTIGGQPAQVFDVGGTLGALVPGPIVGVMRVAAVIPSGITPGNAVPVIVQVGNASSQSGVMIAVSGN